MAAKLQLFVVGLDDFNRETFDALPNAGDIELLPALTYEEMRDDPDADVHAMIELAAERMAAADPAGVVSVFDFPGTIVSAILADRFGLPGPGLEPLLKCEHKYWSRLEQQKVVPDHIPAFAAFDPFDDDALDRIGLVPPFWVKPIKSFRSYLAYSVVGPRQFAEIMEVCRAESPRITEPFLQILRDFDMPHELSSTSDTFIAESSIGGAQCTVEGYAIDGNVVCYGVVDSIREPDSSSFSRYEYPSILPLEIQHRMMDVCRAVMTQFGYAHGPFNAEFFYDQSGDNVWLLEINPRASQSHADLFAKVHGTSHFSIVVDLALGRRPKTLQREGPWNVAAHFFTRAFEPGVVTYVPKPAALERLRVRQPDTRVQLMVDKGTDLARLPNQDSYSYELAHVYVGGRDRLDLLDRHDQVETALQFDIEPAGG